LPGKYDFNQRGGLFAAIQGQGQEPTIASTQDVVGCIALRPMEQTDTCGEVKRMYIRNSVRRNGIGHLLAATIIDHAWENGYTELKLDSLERLKGAVSLYERLGFTRIPPYCSCPEVDHVCMNLFK